MSIHVYAYIQIHTHIDIPIHTETQNSSRQWDNVKIEVAATASSVANDC